MFRAVWDACERISVVCRLNNGVVVCCAATLCDKLRHLANESCNSVPKAVESCQSYLMCIACVSLISNYAYAVDAHLMEPVCM